MSDFALHIYPVAARAKIREIRELERKKLAHLKRELETLVAEDPAVLYWRNKRGRVIFWKASGKKQQGITKDKEKIYSLARLKYLRLRLSDLQNLNEEKWRDSLDGLIDSFEQAGLDLARIIFTKAQYEWAASPQSENPLYRENLKYKTTNGVLVRSKSEQVIGNILELLRVPYRYEPKMLIGNRVFYPDFVIMTTDGRKLILEHLGLMNSEPYVRNIVEKLVAYAADGWLPGKNVFFSFESDTRDPEKIKSIVYDILAA